jgi:hypothetical protein
MRTLVNVNDVWAGMPAEWAAKVPDEFLRANLVNNAVMRVYLDLNNVLTERIKFPLREGNIQTIDNNSTYINIKYALYRDRRFPVITNGDVLEIPIRCVKENDDFFELQVSVVPRVESETIGQTIIHRIGIDPRIKKPLQYALILECYDLQEDNSETASYNIWKQKYDTSVADVRSAMSGVQNVEQRFTSNKRGQAYFGM